MALEQQHELKKVLGVTGVTLLGVGALLGGGVFTILGTTIGIAGTGGTLLAIGGLALGFLCIVAIYAELGTAFPEAGGGYLWVREGLGDLQGFLSGWISWFAHAAAAGLYALSFGFYISQVMRLADINAPTELVRIIAAVAVLALFGFINWRGVATLSRIGNIIALVVLAVLILFVLGGLRAAVSNPSLLNNIFKNSFPGGIVGVLAAMSFFFIAFEGSEIQTQAAEEMRNPGKDLPRALFWARTIVAAIYILVTTALLLGFPHGENVSRAIGQAGEQALPAAAASLLPAGALIIIFGGLLVNLAAINATIFSSSHVVLAMARSRHMLQGLASIHARNKTPHRAVVLSTLFIIVLAIFLPLKAVASLASFLFILLFLQVILAFIALRRRKPKVERPFKAPFFPAWPIATVGLLLILGVSLITQVSPLAGIIGAGWVLFGLVNYFGYATPMERQEIEESTIFTHSWKTGALSHYRILVPISKEEYAPELYEIALALAKQREDPEIMVLEIDETPGNHRSDGEGDHQRAEPLLTRLVERGRERHVSTNGLLLENVDPMRAIFGIIAQQHVNLLILGWDGHARQGMVFSSKVDAMLREARCDTIIVKLADLSHLKRILLCVAPKSNPHLRYMGKIASSLTKAFGGTIDVVTIAPPNASLLYQGHIEDEVKHLVKRMKLGVEVSPRLILHPSPIEAILTLEETHDAIVMGAGRERFFREIRVGSVAEQVTKRARKTAIIVRGHQGILPPLWQYLRER